MKVPLNYAPKYSLSIKYLRMFMTRKELNDLLRKYVEAKLAVWNKKKK